MIEKVYENTFLNCEGEIIYHVTLPYQQVHDELFALHERFQSLWRSHYR